MIKSAAEDISHLLNRRNKKSLSIEPQVDYQSIEASRTPNIYTSPMNKKATKSSPLMVKSLANTFGARSLSQSKMKRSETSSMLPSLKTGGKQPSHALPMTRTKNDRFKSNKMSSIPKPPLSNTAVKEKPKPLNDKDEVESALSVVAKRDIRELKRGSLTSQLTTATTPCLHMSTNKFNRKDYRLDSEEAKTPGNLGKIKGDINFSSTANLRTLSIPLHNSRRKDKKSDKFLNESQKSSSGDKDDSFKSPSQGKTSHKKKIKPKVINIKSKMKSEVDTSVYIGNREILDEFESILSSEIHDFKMINYDRVSPNLIQKFSRCFDKIIQHCDSLEIDKSQRSKAHSNNSKGDNVFSYIKRAYENFIKRIVGINQFSEIETVLKKCLEISSSSKYSLKPSHKDESYEKRKIVKSYSILIDDFKNLAEKRNSLQKEVDEINSKWKHELDQQSKKHSEELRKFKSGIKALKLKLESAKNKPEVSYSKYNKLKQNFKLLLNENDQLNNAAIRYKEQVDDLTQKKNRLNFLIFLCMKNGYPITKLYQEEVKPIDSHRFDLLTPSKYKNSLKKLNEEIKEGTFKKENSKETKARFGLNESFDQLPENFFEELDNSKMSNKSFDYSTSRTKDLNASYLPILDSPAKIPKKPVLIPTLDFKKLEQYNNAVKMAKKKKYEEKMKHDQYGAEVEEIESLLNSL
ncbi:unnamed protein product [Moneuplotes crassus]|uniref:Uncharacterized protein n=1 Tax=Euplotes crassus TaxID=5936 RepID=A0AAD1XUQ3_EUPCR|nr:unnamed protein product [Moneuplotes crassus]